ncbi:MAG: FMN-dependent NADH-azoreductase [Candidatus Woesearchaeota archaeon]|nr:FMN-dependent NADH-azoreductase [Candidatus Woesearchaeota archaeon]
MLVIYAHPGSDGFCSAILDELRKKADFELIDLYNIEYDPVLKKKEHYTSGNDNVSDQNKKFQELLLKHKKIIIVYPIWWNSPPAILKGFFDRVLIPGFAFKFKGKVPVGLLNAKAAVIISHGSPWIAAKLIGRRGAKIVTKDILKMCGIKSRLYKICNARKLTDKKKKEIKKKVDKALRYIHTF